MSALFVACLCADWCGTCREYQPEFEALGRELARHRFVWIDIEETNDMAADIDIDNFPTLLISQGEKILFAGTILPHISHLRRLLQSLEEDTKTKTALPVSVQHHAWYALLNRLRETNH